MSEQATQIVNTKPHDFTVRRRGRPRSISRHVAHAQDYSRAEVPNVTRARILSRAWYVLYQHAGASSLPKDVLVTVGYTSHGARGRLDRRAPAELTTSEWRGNKDEKGFLTIHVERTKSAREVAMAMLFAMGRAAWGRGYKSIGVVKSGHKLNFTGDEAGTRAASAVGAAIEIMAQLPAGHAVIPEPLPQKRQKNYMLKFECPKCGMIVRATKKANIACTSHRPGVRLVIAEARKLQVAKAA